ncbi:hypothetical protein B5F86_01615 [Lachnoclostridium sp. An298]|nr:hypothetical protein B5F86_01615 [Lachnoclostridium sp. An298]
MAVTSSYEVYQRARQSRDEMQEAIVRSLPDLSGVDVKKLYFFMYGAGFIKEQEEQKDEI